MAAAKSPQARKVLRELDKQLADAAAREGLKLVWSAQERAVLDLLASTLDRKAEFSQLYRDAEDPKLKLALGAELHLLEQSAARQLRTLKTDAPAVESPTTVNARRAARTRWDRTSA